MLRIVIPMSGEGRQFAENGYLFPKPLIEIAGRPMIEIVLRNIAPREPHEFIFVCRKEHVDRFALRDVLQQLAPGCRIVTLAQQTAGALCSVLLAADQLGADDDELLVANADQFVDASIDSFLAAARAHRADGSMMVFPSTHPKWSYARVEEGEVVEVAEKRPISPNATAGLYYFRSTREFLQLAEQVILKNAAVGGQFFVCPVYNQYVLSGRRVTVYPMAREQMHSLGTPDDVRTFSATRAFALT